MSLTDPFSPDVGQRVLVVDDHPVFRQGLTVLLQSAPWIDSVVEAATAREAVDVALTAPSPTLAVVDVHLPDRSGLDLVAELKAHLPACRFLVLTMDQDDVTIGVALRAGAHGYLVKDTEPSLLLHSLRTVAEGGRAFGDAVLERGLTPRSSGARNPGPFAHLTAREATIARMICDGGVSNQQIARTEGITEKTVRNAVSVIFRKVGASDRVELLLRAQEHGFAPAPHIRPTRSHHGTRP